MEAFSAISGKAKQLDNTAVGDITKKIFDIIYPIGVVICQSTPPTMGTWEEITDVNGRALWLKKGCDWGSVLSQALPKPVINIDSESHNHKLNGTALTGTSNSAGSGTGVPIYRDLDGVWNKDGAYDNGRMYNDSGSYHQTQDVDWLIGTIAETLYTSHTHTASVSTSGAYGTESKVQPDAYCVKLWRRKE